MNIKRRVWASWRQQAEDAVPPPSPGKTRGHHQATWRAWGSAFFVTGKFCKRRKNDQPSTGPGNCNPNGRDWVIQRGGRQPGMARARGVFLSTELQQHGEGGGERQEMRHARNSAYVGTKVLEQTLRGSPPTWGTHFLKAPPQKKGCAWRRPSNHACCRSRDRKAPLRGGNFFGGSSRPTTPFCTPNTQPRKGIPDSGRERETGGGRGRSEAFNVPPAATKPPPPPRAQKGKLSFPGKIPLVPRRNPGVVKRPRGTGVCMKIPPPF